MDKINTTTAHSAAHQLSSAEKAYKSDAKHDADAQASKRSQEASEEAERAKKVIDSRPSQAQLKFQQSLHAAHGASDDKNA